MSKQIFRSGLAAADDLAVHLTKFIAGIARAGYAEKTRHDKERLIKHFIRWGRKTDIAIADVDEDCVEGFLACPSRRRYKHRIALYQFVRYLRRAEIIPPRHSEPSPGEMLERKGSRPCRSIRRHASTVPAVGQPACHPPESVTMPTPTSPRIRDPTIFEARAISTRHSPAPGITKVAFGESHACVMTAAGKAQCWGSNTGRRSAPPAEFQ